jgi:prepilin-type N-terminal cleavage/methylation domain-containing protein
VVPWSLTVAALCGYHAWVAREAAMRTTSRAGFTLVELMVTVTILAILSTVAVVSYSRYLARGKNMEAIYFLADIGMKQSTYFSVYGQYVDTSEAANSFDDDDFYPTDVAHGNKPWEILCPDNKATYPGWCALGARPGSATVNYQFVTVGWAPGDADPPSAYITDPQRQWWYAVARGDLDGDGTMSTFILSSEISEVFYFDEME